MRQSLTSADVCLAFAILTVALGAVGLLLGRPTLALQAVAVFGAVTAIAALFWIREIRHDARLRREYRNTPGLDDRP